MTITGSKDFSLLDEELDENDEDYGSNEEEDTRLDSNYDEEEEA